MCSTCVRFEAREAAATVGTLSGAVAQLVERLRGTQEVASSNLVSSTLCCLITTIQLVGDTLGGLVAGEGSFVITRKVKPFANGSPRKRFVFQLSMAARDRPLLVATRNFLGFGSITDHPRRRPEWQPMSTLTISSIKGHRHSLIPFCDAYLPKESAKWRQYAAWKHDLDEWDALHPSERVKGTCSEPDCDRPVRGRGVCRIHYYRLTGY